MIIIFFSAFILVFFRAFQQRNVQHELYIPAVFTSFAIATGDVVVIIGAVKYGYDAIPYIGCGGAIGVVSAMYFHKRIFGK